MKKLLTVLYFSILSGLSLSCTQHETTNAEASTNRNTKVKISLNIMSDSLQYTSGIRCIFQDSNGQYWFGSHSEGACLFDGKSFTYFTVSDGLSNNQVRTIQEDENGVIWFGTANGVSSFNGGKITLYQKNKPIGNVVPGTTNNWTLFPTTMWFSAGRKANAIKVDNNRVDYLNFPDSVFAKQPDNREATGFSTGKNGNIWIASYSSVVGYDGKRFTKIDNESLGYNKEGEYLHVRSILEDSKGRLWIGNNGIGVLLKEGNGIINFSKKMSVYDSNKSSNNNPTSPPGTLNHVFAITEVKNGDIWFGDRDTGAWRYDGKSLTNFTGDENLTSQMIWDIYEDLHDNLLFATANGGVYKFKGETFVRVF